MVSSTEIRSDSIVQARMKTKRFIREHWKLSYKEILPVLELFKNGHYQVSGETWKV